MKIVKLLFISFVLSSCSENIFDEIADKDTPEAVYFEAKQEINNSNFVGAIALLESLDPAFLAERERVPVYASAYAGRCGLIFLNLLDSLQNAPAGSVFVILMSAFPGALDDPNVQACIQAETILEGIGDASVRNGDENLLMAFISLAKIGTILSSRADLDDDGVADNDGMPSGTFDQCDNGDFPDATVRELGAGLAQTIQSLAGLSEQYVQDTINEVNNICAQDPNLANFCTQTNPALFSANEVQALRYLVGSNDFGIDSCGGNNFTNCAIANPACP